MTNNNLTIIVLLVLILIVTITLVFLLSKRNQNHEPQIFDVNSIVDNPILDKFMRSVKSRRSYYRDIYLKSDAWQRKRYVVLRRDNWCCVYCGQRATQVHHTRYAKKNIGREPIEWLVSICQSCHDLKHN